MCGAHIMLFATYCINSYFNWCALHDYKLLILTQLHPEYSIGKFREIFFCDLKFLLAEVLITL